jgi:hypothetical protein
MADRRVRATAVALLLAVGLSVTGLGAAAPPPAGATLTDRHLTLQGNGIGTVRFGTPEAAATRQLARQLGAPSSRPPSGCVGGPFQDVAWHNLIAQFSRGRFSGYRYWAPQPHHPVAPRLATAKGITLGSTFGQLEHAYRLAQTGTDFWSAQGMTFGLAGVAYPSPPTAPIYEVKVTVCPAAL